MTIDGKTVQKLGRLKVLDENGDSTALSTLWKDQRVVLVFIRHFGWMIARRQVAELNKSLEVFARKKVQLVVIGNGPLTHMASFRDETPYKGTLFTDPSLKTHKLLGFKKGIATTIGFSPLKAGIRALGSGHYQKGIQGPPLQQGGVLVVGPGNHVHYLYRSKKAGDHPTVAKILEACDL